jgi:hypothetical protein
MPGRTRQNPPPAVLAAEPLDFARLAESAERTRVRTGSTKYGGPKNPFIPLVRQSYQEDTKKKGSGWRANFITGAQTREFVKALREAAEWLADEEIGIRFKYRFRNDAGDVVEQGNLIRTENKKTGVVREGVPEDDRNVEVKYTGRIRRGAVVEDEDEEDESGNGNGEDLDEDEDEEGNEDEENTE